MMLIKNQADVKCCFAPSIFDFGKYFAKCVFFYLDIGVSTVYVHFFMAVAPKGERKIEDIYLWLYWWSIFFDWKLTDFFACILICDTNLLFLQ
jgi:hypothetical protein